MMKTALHDHKASRSLVIIPVKNEAPFLQSLISEIILKSALPVLVVDDKSEDASAEIAESAGATVLRLDICLGPWGAIQTGFRFALETGYDFTVTMDGDGQHLVDFLFPILNPVLAGKADVSVGAFMQRLATSRRAALGFFRFLGNLKCSDITSGMRGYNRRAMELLIADDAILLDYPDFGIFAFLAKYGMKIVEVPVRMKERVAGKSRVFHSWPAIATYLIYTYLLTLSKRR